MAKNKYGAPQPRRKYSEGDKSKGILDDYAVRGNVATKEGTIQHTPTADNHITNKKFTDDTYVNATGDTMTGALTITEASTGQLNIGYDANNYISMTIDSAGDFSFLGHSDGADADLKFTPESGGEIDMRAEMLVTGTIRTRSYGGAMWRETPSDTNPTVGSNQGDSNTGLGHAANDQLSLIAGGVEGIRITESGGGIVVDLNGDLNVSGCYSLQNGTIIGGSCISDISTKKDVRDYSESLDALRNLSPKEFEFKDNHLLVGKHTYYKEDMILDKNGELVNDTGWVTEDVYYNFPEGTQTGFIADEVEQVFPDMVTTDKYGFKRISYDFRWIFKLWKQNQEQQKQIDKINDCLSASKDFDEYKKCVEEI